MTWSLAWVTGMEAIPENKRRGEEGRHRDGKGCLGSTGFGASEMRGDTRQAAGRSQSGVQGRSGLESLTVASSPVGWSR